MANHGQIVTDASLPQEIIDDIIDEVALATQETDQLGELPSTESLKACSLVSKAFLHRSRMYFLSHIRLVADTESGEKTAGRLVKLLRHKANSGLLAHDIRSLTFVVEVPCLHLPRPRSTISTISRQKVSNLLKALDSSKSSSFEALGMLTQAHIQDFSLGAQNGFLNWNTHHQNIHPIFLRFCSGQSLTSLRLFNLSYVPEGILVNAFCAPNLKHLKLHTISIACVEEEDSGQVLTRSRPTVSKLEILEISRLSYTAVLQALRICLLPSASLSSYFSYLRVLVVSVPSSLREMDVLWKFMLGVANGLESLDLQYDIWPGTAITRNGPIRLNQMTALRHLKFSSNAEITPHELEPKLMSLTYLLASADSPSGLESIKANLYISSNLHLRKQAVHITRSLEIFSNPGWAAVDVALTGGFFTNLKIVAFDVNLFHYDPSIQRGYAILDDRITIPSLFRLTRTRALFTQVQINLNSVFSPHISLSSYLHQFE
ncbi:hypothetical protein GALMADRAFT_227525 [Galerina marginata CBS 339.88]|uniref:F-box domain-containing protein n=1 Tax=Galerina marginata (strain CBS 339.88) TaxID=685588 RepID=A0A067SU89_GALM3|nr:hypothetical protein GALMADRAFT_227525 [Galerina marginata CBS 339.88]